jgi:glycosyltransferase involved in cell wall biosynthesis
MSESQPTAATAATLPREPVSARAAKPIPSISVVMPAYNEGDVLPVSLHEAVDALEEIANDWEILVVDDGSRDDTPRILAEWSAREPRITVLTQACNQGYSKALIRGFKAASKDAVFYTDADAQFDLREIARLYPLLDQHDMVSGYRLNRQDPPIRLLTSRVFNALQALLLGNRVRDVNCAFKLFRRSFFDQVELSSDGFLIDAELYLRAKKAGLKRAQVGVRHRPRTLGNTTVRPATIAQTLRALWNLSRSV